MSRAFRIKVQESLRKVIKASDHVGTKLELLEVLPKDAMAELLSEDLEVLGFVRDGEVLKRTHNGVTVEIDPTTGDVKLSSEVCAEREFKKTAETFGDTDWSSETKKQTREDLRKKAQKQLESQAAAAERQLTEKATEQLEDGLRELQAELDGVVNRVTAKALKKKAASLGEIKSVTEDTDSGSMTIVLEV